MEQYKIQQIINNINCGLLSEAELLRIYQIAVESHQVYNTVSQNTNYLPSSIYYKKENGTGDVYPNPNEKKTGDVYSNPNDIYKSTPIDRIDMSYYSNYQNPNHITTLKAGRVVPDRLQGFVYKTN